MYIVLLYHITCLHYLWFFISINFVLVLTCPFPDSMRYFTCCSLPTQTWRLQLLSNRVEYEVIFWYRTDFYCTETSIVAECFYCYSLVVWLLIIFHFLVWTRMDQKSLANKFPLMPHSPLDLPTQEIRNSHYPDKKVV